MSYTLSQKISLITFAIFFFFALFGTSMPFQERMQEMEEVTTSNAFNQLVNMVLLLGALIALVLQREAFWRFIKKEKIMSIFLLWCMLSILWSDFPMTSAKRFLQILTVYLVCISFCISNYSNWQLLKVLKITVIIYLGLSLLSVLFIPQAIDPSFESFRGMTPHKNYFGQLVLSCLILSFIFFFNQKGTISRSISILMILIAIFLILGTESSTTLLNAFILLSVAVLIGINRFFKQLQIGNTLIFFLFFMGGLFFMTLYILTPESFKIIPALFEKDLTFSGRVDLWAIIVEEIKTHPLQGAGYQSFWVLESKTIQLLHEIFIWMPIQAHNGYLDMINEVGIIGFTIFLIMLTYYFTIVFRKDLKHQWKWFVIMVLIYNITETTLFRPGHFTAKLFIFSYLNLFTES